MSQICKNCGENIDKHHWDEAQHDYWCSKGGKKFEAERNFKIPEAFVINVKKPQKKGCGKHKYKDKDPFEEVNPKCGVNWICKECSGNHTPQKACSPSISKEKEPDGVSNDLRKFGSNPSSGSDFKTAMPGSAVFDLSEKIKESIDYGIQLYYEGKNNNCSEGDGCPICNSCQSQIKQKIKRQVVKDVKTFIKKLKPLVNKYVKYTVDKMAMWDEIYKLAGKNLSGRD